MKKRMIMSLLLAVVMCVGLAAPAFAASVPALEPDAAGSVVTPRYAVYEMPYRLYIGASTYADITFSVADKGGSYCFDGINSMGWYAENSDGFYWIITDYSYTLSNNDKICHLTIFRKEMFNGTPTDYTEKIGFTLPIDQVLGIAVESGPAVVPSGICIETYGFRMSREEFHRQVETSGIESVPRVTMRYAD